MQDGALGDDDDDDGDGDGAGVGSGNGNVGLGLGALVDPQRSGSVDSAAGSIGATTTSNVNVIGTGNNTGASLALQRHVRALDSVQRIGRLLTLDLKGNEIRVSAVPNASEMDSGELEGSDIARLSR